jgi:hypothetical protein
LYDDDVDVDENEEMEERDECEECDDERDGMDIKGGDVPEEVADVGCRPAAI